MDIFYKNKAYKVRLATIDDFHFQGKRRVGLKFFVLRTDGDYDRYTMSEKTKSEKLQSFIDADRVFVHD